MKPTTDLQRLTAERDAWKQLAKARGTMNELLRGQAPKNASKSATALHILEAKQELLRLGIRA